MAIVDCDYVEGDVVGLVEDAGWGAGLSEAGEGEDGVDE